MTRKCVVTGCSNHYHKDSPTTFHRFPRDKAVRKRWLSAIRAPDFEPANYQYICSVHFASWDFASSCHAGHHLLRPHSVPSKFPWTSQSDVIDHVDHSYAAARDLPHFDHPYAALEMPGEEWIKEHGKTKQQKEASQRPVTKLNLFCQKFPKTMDGLCNPTGLEQCLYCLEVFGSEASLAQHKHQMHELLDEEEDVEAVIKTEVLSDADDDSDDHRDYVGDDDDNEPCKEEAFSHEMDVKTELKREEELSTAYHGVKAEILSDDDYKSSFTRVDFTAIALKIENSTTQFSNTDEKLFVGRIQDNKRTLSKEEPAQTYDHNEPGKEEVLSHEMDVKTELKREDEVSTAFYEVKPEILSDDDYESFSDSGTLKNLVQVPTGERSYRCSVCKKILSRSGNFHRHMRVHTREKPFECRVCKKTFAHSSNLKKHMQVHLGEKPYECSECKKTFSYSQSLKYHMQTHIGERPYECSLCKKSFSQSGHLKQHMQVHSGEKPYKCSECKKTFSYSYSLKCHMQTHTGERPYECSVCKKSFFQSSNLKQHMQVHSGEKSYECSVCKKTFSLCGTLKRHVQIHALK